MKLISRVGLFTLTCCLVAGESQAANGRRLSSGVVGVFGSSSTRNGQRASGPRSRPAQRAGIGMGPSGRGIGTGLSGNGVGMGSSGTGFGMGASGTGIGTGLSGKGIGMGASGNGIGTGLSGQGVGMGRSGTGVGGAPRVPRKSSRTPARRGRR